MFRKLFWKIVKGIASLVPEREYKAVALAYIQTKIDGDKPKPTEPPVNLDGPEDQKPKFLRKRDSL